MGLAHWSRCDSLARRDTVTCFICRTVNWTSTRWVSPRPARVRARAQVETMPATLAPKGHMPKQCLHVCIRSKPCWC
jgi:hypothetical protein